MKVQLFGICSDANKQQVNYLFSELSQWIKSTPNAVISMLTKLSSQDEQEHDQICIRIKNYICQPFLDKVSLYCTGIILLQVSLIFRDKQDLMVYTPYINKGITNLLSLKSRMLLE